jgi:hypothetical protein
MAAAGTEEAKRLMSLPMEQLIGSERPDEWWSVQENAGGGDAPAVGWVHLKPTDVEHWGDTRESRFRIDREHVVVVNEGWHQEGEAGSYRYDMKRSESNSAEDDAKFGVTSTQITLLNHGRLGTRASFGQNSLQSPGGAAPPGFVPGGWLARAFGRLEAKPMILRTESVPTSAGRAVVLPIRLVVTPSGPEKTAEDGKTSLRCVSVAINGTGEVDRYYFRPDGTLDSIDLPDHLHQTQSDEANVKFLSSGDARMTP